MAPSVDLTRPLARSRVATGGVFTAFGIVIGTWSSRLPAVAEHVDAGHAELGAALMCLAAGCICGMVAVGRALERFGAAVLMPLLIAALGLVLPLTVVVPTLPVLCAVLVLLGFIQGTCNVTMNAHGSMVQRASRRPIMAGLHALFSIGGFVGAGVGAVVAGVGGGAFVTFAVAAVVAVAAAAAAWTWRYQPDELGSSERAGVPRERGAGGTRTGKPPGWAVPRTLLLGLLALIGMMVEGAVGDWGAVYLRDAVGATASIAALAYSVFAVAMTLARLVADRVGERLGSVAVVRWSGFVAMLSLVLAVSVPSPVMALLGFACLGVGLAAITPTVFGAAGETGQSMSVVVGLGYVGFLVGPAVIGFTSAGVGLRFALLVPATLLLVVVVGADALRAPRSLNA
ncbi:MFS transporter [Streptomyces sp. NPDC102381]|uniref:MFS transporter n=1 Tax=Streptomyces sp. NPDC102381 TaxID=3366164 RepID=UPI0038217A18